MHIDMLYVVFVYRQLNCGKILQDCLTLLEFVTWIITIWISALGVLFGIDGADPIDVPSSFTCLWFTIFKYYKCCGVKIVSCHLDKIGCNPEVIGQF